MHNNVHLYCNNPKTQSPSDFRSLQESIGLFLGGKEGRIFAAVGSRRGTLRIFLKGSTFETALSLGIYSLMVCMVVGLDDGVMLASGPHKNLTFIRLADGEQGAAVMFHPTRLSCLVKHGDSSLQLSYH